MPVKFDQRIEIDAPAERVWAIITDPTTWPQWFPEIDEVTEVGAVEAGGDFRWRHGDDTGMGSIADVDATANRLKIVTQKGNSPTTHTFDVDRAGGMLGRGGNDARLRYTLEYDPPGGMLGDFIAGGNPMDTLKVKQALEKVRNLALMGG
jgi:carbon monoxide dehydrogenase subunit G